MKKYFVLILLLVLGFALSKGDDGVYRTRIITADTAVHILDIGDRLPDLVIPNMINYPSQNLKLADFKGQCIILDFWGVRCSSCVEGFPKMQKLQNEYPGKLIVILVNYQPKLMIEQFLARHKKITGQSVNLPIVCGDTLLTGLFQPSGFPQYVWIDQAGIIRHITYSFDLTPENIESFVNNKPFNTGKKSNEAIPADFSKPLFIDGNGGNSKSIIYSSVISKHVDNMPSSGVYNNPGDSNSSIYACESPVKEQFQIAFNDFLNGYWIPDNRTELRARDTSRYVWKINGKYQFDNCYEYQLIAPYKSVDQLRKMMREDLTRFFGLEAHMEKRVVKCWVLTCEDTSLLITKGGYYRNLISAENYALTIQNAPDSLISQMFVYVIFYESPYPFVSDIHMKSNIDIILNEIDYNKAEDVIKALHKKYKINIRLEDRTVDFLVISEPCYEPKPK